ncbi:FAD/NAD(P)-binding domain-containing protein [Stipitochalara longipes BDJ]|nr:FAD/NAD(P)-binding domain-containing protein [Stipitochalara longipes BDJ]
MPSAPPTRVLIIGAGWYGLAAAKTYLELFPNIALKIVDQDSTVGGVWSASRSYPGLLADSPPANFDFSDLPMDEELGIEKWADLPAEKVHEYLERYVDRFALRPCLRLRTRVLGVEKDDEGVGWKVDLEEISEGAVKRESMMCDKLIIAAGVNSIPRLPDDVDWSGFAGPVMHSKDVGERHALLTAERVKRVTVVGGNKSAVDVVYLCAKAGKEVDWIISPDGYGPGILFEARTKSGTSYASIKLARMSLITGPSVLNLKRWWYWFLHSGKSWVGSWLLRMVMKVLTKEMMEMYRRNEKTMKIAPDLPDMFWSPAAPSVIHDSEFFDLVAEGKQIHVHRATITSLSSHSALLSNSEALPSDALVFATGWMTSHSSIFHPNLLLDLGFPTPLSDQDPGIEKHWNALDTSSMQNLKSLFPMLANPPKKVVEYDALHAKKAATTPFRLFRGMVPPTLAARGDRSLVVLGLTLNISIPIMAEVSSLWGIAYLENLPLIPQTKGMLESKEEMEREVSVMNNMGWLRFRDRGMPYVDGGEVTQSFIDQLVRDLGLRSDRKVLAGEKEGGRGLFGWRAWWSEWTDAYVGADYRGLVDEYRRKWRVE